MPVSKTDDLLSRDSMIHEPLFFLNLTLRVTDASGEKLTTRSWCVGPSESEALARWKRSHPKLAKSLASHEIATPKPQPA